MTCSYHEIRTQWFYASILVWNKTDLFLITLHLSTRLTCTQADLDLATGSHMFALGFPTWPQRGGGVSVALAVGPRMGRAVEEKVQVQAGSGSSY